MLDRLTGNEEALFNEAIDKFFAAADVHDTETIKAMLAPNILTKVPDIDRQLEAFFNFYTGPLEGYDTHRTPWGSYSNQYGTKTAEMGDSFLLTAGGNTYYCNISIMYRNDENPDAIGIQYVDLVSEEAKNGKYFLWADDPGINIQREAGTGNNVMILYGNPRKYTPVERTLTEQDFAGYIKYSTNFEDLVAEMGEPNGELMSDEFVFRLVDTDGEKRYAICEVSFNNMIEKIIIVNEERVLYTLWETDTGEKESQ